MKLVTLQRHAPVTPGAVRCRLCDASIEGSVQDRVLVGPPGASQLDLAICLVCGQAIQRLMDVAGPELSFVVQGGAPGVEQRARGPIGSVPGKGALESTLDDARRELTTEADNLARTEQKLRTEAERLGSVRPPAP
ncbi:MAG: hypothetical protein JO023_26915 [Chloroflexi bacterium]|nr:hypothetical protein [Chloroflexota bacterium]